MKKSQVIRSLVIFYLLINTAICTGEQTDELYQVSTLNALMYGVYDGNMTLDRLIQHGDFGLGTFNSLDGEMVVLDGIVYQIPWAGEAVKPSGSTKTPFAVVTFFDTDKNLQLPTGIDYTGLKNWLKKELPTPNIFYALKLIGKFKTIKTRSVARQKRPYRPLKEVVDDQKIFNFQDIYGTVVGFISPSYIKGVNVPGYHLHFINRDRNVGGHVMSFEVYEARLEIDEIHDISITLPNDKSFYAADLGASTDADVSKVEHGEKDKE